MTIEEEIALDREGTYMVGLCDSIENSVKSILIELNSKRCLT